MGLLALKLDTNEQDCILSYRCYAILQAVGSE